MLNDWTFLDLWLDVFAGISRIFAGSFKKKQKGLYYFFHCLWLCSSWERQDKECCELFHMSFTPTAGFTLVDFFPFAMGFQDVPRMYYLANFIDMVLQHISIGRGPNGKSTCTTPCQKNVRRAYGGMSGRNMVQRNVRSALRWHIQFGLVVWTQLNYRLSGDG